MASIDRYRLAANLAIGFVVSIIGHIINLKKSENDAAV